MPDPAVPSTPISPKVVFATVLAFVAPALIAAASYIIDNGVSIIGISNPILGTLVIALLTSAITFLGAYMKRDTLREAGARRAAGPDGFVISNKGGDV